jgi:hypothetical protein
MIFKGTFYDPPRFTTWMHSDRRFYRIQIIRLAIVFPHKLWIQATSPRLPEKAKEIWMKFNTCGSQVAKVDEYNMVKLVKFSGMIGVKIYLIAVPVECRERP